MTMTRKDYEAVATALRTVNVDAFTADEAISEVAQRLANLFYETGGLDRNGNRRFDRDRFLRAAGQ